MRLITRLIRALRAALAPRPAPALAWVGVIRLRLHRARAAQPGR